MPETFSAVATHLSIGRSLSSPNTGDSSAARYSTSKHDAWLPRRRALQPLFTKQHVTQFGGHMAECADKLSHAWGDGAELDLDHECRRLTLQVLAQSMLGLDLDARADALLAELLRTAATYITDRAVRPVRAPWWLPTAARRRARAASATIS